jgi:palmitoyltransferase
MPALDPPAALALFLSFYVAVMGTAFYVCVVADPNTSKWAKYFTVDLPRAAQGLMSRAIGARGLDVVDSLLDRLLAIVYCAVMSAAWTAVFFSVYPWVDRLQQHAQAEQMEGNDGGGGASSLHDAAVPAYHKYVGYAVFAACGLTWRWASTASPGIVTPETLARYDHYPYDGVLFLPGVACPVTRRVPKLARSKYDRHRYRQNVARFDHFCGWVYNTVGEENYRHFLLFLVVHAGACGYGTCILWRLFRGEVHRLGLHDAVSYVDRTTGLEYRPTRWIVVQFLFHNYMWESSLLLLTGVMTVALGAFLGYHCYLTSVNMTTNEAYKWGQVKSWHKQEIKRYRQALKRGTAVASREEAEHLSSASPSQADPHHACDDNDDSYADAREHPVVDDDHDVTCAGGASGSGNNASNGKAVSTPAMADRSRPRRSPGRGRRREATPVRHPGPYPRNLYDRGIVENWKEVLFPLSLRSDDDRSRIQFRNQNNPHLPAGPTEQERTKTKTT